jgi:DNA-binding NarL/FixJ family response regulator
LSSPTDPIRVVAVDDSAIFRRTLAHLLEDEPEIKLVGIAERGHSALELIDRHRPEVAVVDQRMPGLSGADLTRRLRSDFPQVAVIALTVSEDQSDLADILRAGARGYVLKSNAASEIAPAVRAAARGESWLSPRVAAKLIDSYAALPATAISSAVRGRDELTQRELTVLAHLAQGMTNRQIAEALGVSEATVKSHVGHLMSKLGVRNRAEATAVAWRHGFTAGAERG